MELSGVLKSSVTRHLGFHVYDRHKYGKKRPLFGGEVTTIYHGNACENQIKVGIDHEWSGTRVSFSVMIEGENSEHVYYATATQS
jgi:hypothetical protein